MQSNSFYFPGTKILVEFRNRHFHTHFIHFSTTNLYCLIFSSKFSAPSRYTQVSAIVLPKVFFSFFSLNPIFFKIRLNSLRDFRLSFSSVLLKLTSMSKFWKSQSKTLTLEKVILLFPQVSITTEFAMLQIYSTNWKQTERKMNKPIYIGHMSRRTTIQNWYFRTT